MAAGPAAVQHPARWAVHRRSKIYGRLDCPAAEWAMAGGQAALALARLMDNPRAVNQQPAAAKVLISMLDKLRSASPAGRRGLAVVREMTKKGGA
jgi:hypothetical protein